MDPTSVATVFLRNRSEILLLQRSDDVGSYQGQWGAVAGHVEDAPEASARREISEETGLESAAVSLVRAGEPFGVDDAELEKRWLVHPFLFECATREVALNWESTTAEWVSPLEIRSRRTVPKLWTSYDRIRPTVETIRTDSTHGSSYISLRALEVLRDEAGILADDGADGAAVRDVATAVLAARPAMTVIANRINRVMAETAHEPTAISQAAHDACKRAADADSQAAIEASQLLTGRVATLSWSGTVIEALERADPEALLVAESRPGGEGVALAERFADVTDVTLTSDAGFAHALATTAIDTLVVGADAILADGRLVNKVGTRPAAIAASHERIDVVVVAAADKISPVTEGDLEPREETELYDGDTQLDIEHPTFDVTPADCITHYVTEDGTLDTAAVRSRAAKHASLASWQDTG